MSKRCEKCGESFLCAEHQQVPCGLSCPPDWPGHWRDWHSEDHNCPTKGRRAQKVTPRVKASDINGICPICGRDDRWPEQLLLRAESLERAAVTFKDQRDAALASEARQRGEAERMAKLATEQRDVLTEWAGDHCGCDTATCRETCLPARTRVVLSRWPAPAAPAPAVGWGHGETEPAPKEEKP